MCGIAGYLSTNRWTHPADLSWLDRVVADLHAVASGARALEHVQGPLEELTERFDDLMSFGVHAELAAAPETFETVSRLSDLLHKTLERITDTMLTTGVTDQLEHLAESTRDCSWQIKEEVLGNVQRVTRLIPQEPGWDCHPRSCRFVAWAAEMVLENLDRLEVRGRDSAGISIQVLISPDAVVNGLIVDRWPSLLKVPSIEKGVLSSAYLTHAADGRPVVTYVYKIANLVGRLGDNTAGLRDAIRSSIRDPYSLWRTAHATRRINVAAHTRWASNGVISIPNCHPTDGTLFGKEDELTIADREAQFCLNGDVDNYQDLVESCVRGKGFAIDPAVTTDAKILPVFYRLGTDPAGSPSERFASLMRSCDGSLAIVMQHPAFPRRLFMGQKGSGQSLFIGRIHDGFVLASEVYGLAAVTRKSYALSGTEKGGTMVVISADEAEGGEFTGRYLEQPEPFLLKPDPIYIHSRDIYRGAYDYYFEKEIHEAPLSVRKTIKGKYRKINGRVEFLTEGRGTLSGLIARLRDPGRPRVRRIMVLGQGTASIAAMGTAYLIERALRRTRVVVNWTKASEMSGFRSDDPLEDMLVIAISQSGTTTDTNRTVDVAAAQGAWVHSIVNRRNSPLVSKSHSHFYTSDGRDVEMAVASTKAFYSQVAAGKLIALLLAQEMESMTPEEILSDIQELEKLPADIEWVLDQGALIKQTAEQYGPTSRNWAVVGNGPNKIAAEEIRIKLSELCYKSIPCDFTEDKKHIDLSTEPLTIVVANDLPDQIVQDTAKEVAIFKAHSGKPIVLCARGEKRFNEYAERVIELPPTSAGLGFVTATVAGHLWGFHAARAIDQRVEILRDVRSSLTRLLDSPDAWNPSGVQSSLHRVLAAIGSGDMNAALPASTVASLALYAAQVTEDLTGNGEAKEKLEQGIALLTKAIEDVTRPIDTIRHQAKTVTVGISRPQEMLPPLFLKSFLELSVSPSQVKETDRRMIRTVGSMIAGIEGGLLYRMVASSQAGAPVPGESPRIQLVCRAGNCLGKPSRYDVARPAGGSKRTALRLERAVWTTGGSGTESLLLVPVFDEHLGECVGIVLFHIGFVPQASVDQKLGVLRALGNRFHEVRERFEEVSRQASLEEFLEGIAPRDLVLAPLESLGI